MIARPSPALPSAAVAVLLFSLVTSAVSEDAAAQCATQWQAALGSGMNGYVQALTTTPNGDLVAGGSFTMAGGVSANHVARWNGTSWSALGSGMNGAYVLALTTLPSGELVAGGHFTTAGGVSANRVARWNGTTWSALGSGLAGGPPNGTYVFSLATLPNGDLVAGGQFALAGGVSADNIARWNGTSWSPLGSGMAGGFLPTVSALRTLPNGDLVAAGNFATAGGVAANSIARWNGTSWSALGSGMNPSFGLVAALAVLPNGDLVAAGNFATAGGVAANNIARWNGTSWSALGSGLNNPVVSLTTLPNGDLVAGGQFTTAGGVSANYIARWNGTNWSALVSGMSGSGVNTGVFALATLPNGDLVAGGNFTAVGVTSAYVVEIATTCPATAVSYGAGCTGSGGPNVLVATSLPWVGSTFRSVATGIPALALALGVFGFSTMSIPMPAILPQGVPGCTLLASPDRLDLHVPAAGIVQTQLVIPNAVSLAGVVLHQQVVPIEFSGTGSITALTGTNALTLTIGSF